jgi:hypothetical protein
MTSRRLGSTSIAEAFWPMRLKLAALITVAARHIKECFLDKAVQVVELNGQTTFVVAARHDLTLSSNCWAINQSRCCMASAILSRNTPSSSGCLAMTTSTF